jgi:ribosomal-protein-alanine N-acetyltransferase
MEKDNSVEFTIRPMKVEDVDQVHDLDVLSFNLPWPKRSYLFELNENPASRQWVVDAKSESGEVSVVGMLVLWLIVDEAHIGTIAIHPDFRRCGLGRRLLAHALLEALPAGIQRVFLEVRAHNLAAQEMYRQFGFTVEGIRPRYYRDTNEDALLMNLESPDPATLRKFASDTV